MGRRLHLIAAIVFVLMLGYDLHLWGGLARHPQLGTALQKASRNDISLGSLYLQAGAPLLDMAGMGSSAAQSATDTFGPLLASIANNPAAAMDNLQREMPFGPKFSYYGAPLMLLATLVLWWRRPREVHMIGRR